MYDLATTLAAISPVALFFIVIWVGRALVRRLRRASPTPPRPYNLVDYYIDTEVGKVPTSVALWWLFRN